MAFLRIVAQWLLFSSSYCIAQDLPKYKWEMNYTDKIQAPINVFRRAKIDLLNRWGSITSNDPLDYAAVCAHHKELVREFGDLIIPEEELYGWKIWFVGHPWRPSYRMRAIQMETNLLNYYPRLKITRKKDCDCESEPPNRVIIIIIKLLCYCFDKSDSNILIFDVVDAYRRFPILTHLGFVPHNWGVIAQTGRHKELYDLQGFDTFLIPHHTTLTTQAWEGKYPFKKTVRYPSEHEKFHLGMHFGSHGGTPASDFEFNWNTTEFVIWSAQDRRTKKFTFDRLLEFNAALIWTKNNETKEDLLYKGPTRAATAASLRIPVIMHNGFVGHHEFASIRTDLHPYEWLTNDGLQVREFIDTWVAHKVVWQSAKRHAYELARCYHSAMIADMYVCMFSYLIRKKFNDS
jgi:hypothetical protein